jgi:hypothetical protein
MYARCKGCQNLYMNMGGNLQPYVVDASMKAMIEQSLGFAPSAAAPAAPVQVPKQCPSCTGALEVSKYEGETVTRCSRCGMLASVEGSGLRPIVVTPPGGGWDAEFQAIFETKLGFKKKVRKLPPGVPE